jgi:hypothetical protein
LPLGIAPQHHFTQSRKRAMYSPTDKIEEALYETRILMLGTQVLLSFAFLAPFQDRFNAFPQISRYLVLAALCFLLVAFSFLLMPVCYHQLIGGRDTEQFHKIITRSLKSALFPFALALGVDIYVSAEKIIGPAYGLLSGIGAAASALFLWYGLEILTRRPHATRNISQASEPPRNNGLSETPKLKEKIKEVLTEVRVVLPGLQALLGFQFITIFHESFDQLPGSSKYLHLASLGLIAFSIMLLMSPAAFHRIAESGHDSPRLRRFSSTMIISAMILLALGLGGDLFVVVRKITDSFLVSLGAASMIVCMCYGLWFGVTFYLRHQRRVVNDAL